MYYVFPLYPEFNTLMRTTPTTLPKLWTMHARDIFQAEKGGERGVSTCSREDRDCTKEPKMRGRKRNWLGKKKPLYKG